MNEISLSGKPISLPKSPYTLSNYPELMTLSVTKPYKRETLKLNVTLVLHPKMRFVYKD